MKRNTRLQRYINVLKGNRRLLIPPTILLVLILALCIFAIKYATSNMVSQRTALSERTARSAAEGLRLQLSVLAGALHTLSTFIQTDPDWNTVSADFPVVASEVLSQILRNTRQDIGGVAYMPFGRVTAVYDFQSGIFEVPGTDVLAPGYIDQGSFLEAIEQRGNSFVGPVDVSETSGDLVVARCSVFIPDVLETETFNNPYNVTAPSSCPSGLGQYCYDNKTREKFWGFVTVYFAVKPFFSNVEARWNQLGGSGYAFRVVRRDKSRKTGAMEEEVLSGSGSFGEVVATSRVDVQGINWHVDIHNPDIRQAREVQDGLIAMIVVVAVILSVFLLLLLTSNREAAQLLQEQLITTDTLKKANSHLAEAKCVLETEKKQKEMLLDRQLGLIACFEHGQRKREKKHERAPLTLACISEIRGSMTSNNTQEQDDVQIFELLGEGSFGKVHKGLWRGTVVAIKIMLLPANMSGAEKREKMVVWEAAISSSLLHPNIVQTYTYNVKPIKDDDKQDDGGEAGLKDLGSAVQICNLQATNVDKGRECSASKAGSPQFQSNSSQRVSNHGFEVQLVLEYCDRGTLRNALDQGVFMSDTGLNYPAILDSAIDIARAMLHLHCNNVLHMDLKARNVLLASSGTEERGMCCKISDFGLAVCMETTDTHMSEIYQGTSTHMAPEVLVDGHVSKAADVYAFGITLWELYTGGQPHRGVPKALLGHQVAKNGVRPKMPIVMPEGYKVLMVKCWSHRPEHRPSFAQALEELVALREEIPEATPPVQLLHASQSRNGHCRAVMLQSALDEDGEDDDEGSGEGARNEADRGDEGGVHKACGGGSRDGRAQGAKEGEGGVREALAEGSQVGCEEGGEGEGDGSKVEPSSPTSIHLRPPPASALA